MKLKYLILPLILLLALILFLTFKHFHINPLKTRGLPASQDMGKNPDYRLVFVGDSMTEYLGNFDELRGFLKNYYPDKTFLLLNYGFSSTSILSLPERIEKESTHSGRTFEAINNIPFDLIFIESMGHNPLSEFPLEEGLKKQTESLEQALFLLSLKHPKEKIIFVATIAPNKSRYGEGVVTLMPEEREKWAKEREEYINNHINFAKTHQLQLLNIYEKSLKDGTGNIDLINTNDFIHPSPTGIYFIQKEIADFIKENNLISK